MGKTMGFFFQWESIVTCQVVKKYRIKKKTIVQIHLKFEMWYVFDVYDWKLYGNETSCQKRVFR